MVDTSTGCDEITFLFSSPARPHAPYRYDLDADRLHAIPGNNAHDPAATTTMLRATSRDGTEVPCFLTHLATVDRDRPQPTLILAYGAWNLPNSPRYTLAAAAFVLSGGIVAHPILRGGGEHGSRWWHEGRRHNKQNTFDDLFGGLTAGAAVTQRPDLFGAVVITAPLLDLLRAEPTRNIPSETTKSELGDPSDPADAAVLAGYSPYQHLSAADYPPILVVAAEHDVRTPPWHSRKFVARLQSVTTSTNPALLRILKAMGHGTGATPASERTTEWLGFIMKHLGVRPGDGNVSPSGHRPSLQP
jgi:prolyl oligopeptidase